MRRRLPLPARILVLGALLASAIVLVGTWSTRRALAALHEQALAAGPQLADWTDLLGGQTTVELNGHTLHLSSLVTEQSLDAVLARFEQHCGESARSLTAALATLPRAENERRFTGVMRARDGQDRRIAACLAQPETSSVRALAQRAVRFAQTGDLAVFGHVRSLFARRGTQGTTHVLLTWSDGPLHVARMFPAEGDATGSDLTHLPRPRAARRLLSAQVAERPYGVVAYAVPGTPEAALARYREELAAQGASALQVANEEIARGTLMVLEHEGVQTLAQSFRQQGQTVIALVRMSAHTMPRDASAPGAKESDRVVD